MSVRRVGLEGEPLEDLARRDAAPEHAKEHQRRRDSEESKEREREQHRACLIGEHANRERHGGRPRGADQPGSVGHHDPHEPAENPRRDRACCGDGKRIVAAMTFHRPRAYTRRGRSLRVTRRQRLQPDARSTKCLLVAHPITTYRMVLEGIRFRAKHGASRAERDLPQDFVVTLEVELPVSALPRTDSLARVFDYGKLASLIVEEGTRASYRLLETLGQRLVERVFEDTPAILVTLRIKKFGPPTPVSVDAASIELSSRRQG